MCVGVHVCVPMHMHAWDRMAACIARQGLEGRTAPEQPPLSNLLDEAPVGKPSRVWGSPVLHRLRLGPTQNASPLQDKPQRATGLSAGCGWSRGGREVLSALRTPWGALKGGRDREHQGEATPPAFLLECPPP